MPVVGLVVIVSGCGAGPAPPPRAVSEREIRDTVVTYNALSMQGNGEGACELKDDQSLKGLPGFHAPGVHDCTSLWNYMGPKFDDRVRAMVLGDRVGTVSVSGRKATATILRTGDKLSLVWSGGRWKLK